MIGRAVVLANQHIGRQLVVARSSSEDHGRAYGYQQDGDEPAEVGSHGSGSPLRWPRVGGYLSAKDLPFHVRPKLLASDLASCQPLDFWAMLSGRPPAVLFPLSDCRPGNPESGREDSLRAENSGRNVDGMLCHGAKYRFSVLSESRQSVPERQGNLYAAGMDLKKWIREARKAKSWTQTQLGDAVGLTKQNVSSWENGRHEPSFAQMVKIAELTGYALPGDHAPGLTAAEPIAAYAESLELSPSERDLVLALRKLPEEEQQETVRDVMHRAETIEQMVEKVLAARGISISAYVTAARAAETLPAPPSAKTIPARKPGDPDQLDSPVTRNQPAAGRKERKA